MRQHNGFGALSKAGASFRATTSPVATTGAPYATVSGTSTSYQDIAAATSGTTYTYAVVARNIVGVSEAAEAP